MLNIFPLHINWEGIANSLLFLVTNLMSLNINGAKRNVKIFPSNLPLSCLLLDSFKDFITNSLSTKF